MTQRTWMVALLMAAGCSDGAKTDDTGTETGDTAAEASRGLPEGSSTWTGTVELAGLTFPMDLEIVNTGGDLEGTVTYSDNPDAPLGFGSVTQTLTGTHEPTSGLFALAPLDFVEDPSMNLSLLGATGTYDPDTDTISGMIADFASGDDNNLYGGPLSATRTGGDGEPTTPGELGAALGAGSHSVTGTMQCTSDPREVAGTLDYDGQGAIGGSLIIGDTSVDTPLGTFEFTGVHNPSTGGITLVPGLWVDPDHSTLTFFVDGTYDASSGAWTGDQRTNLNACPPATWDVIVE